MNLDRFNFFERIFKKKLFVVDIETTGLLSDVHTFEDLHVLSFGHKVDGEWRIGSTKDRDAIKRLFENPDHIIVGHFFLGYDIRVIKKIIPEIDVKAFIIDTLALSHYLFNERLKHGLEDWGVDVGFEKVKISEDEWKSLNYEKAVERCERDVLINAKIWDKFELFLVELYGEDHRSMLGAVKRCNFKNILLSIQDDNRILLDVKKTEENLAFLEGIIESKKEELMKVMPKIPVKVTKNKPKNLYKKDGSLSKAGEEWKALTSKLNLDFEYNGPIELIKSYQEPNPTSNAQLKDYLFSLGWKPLLFKDGANGKVPQLRDDDKNLCKSILKLIETVPELEALQGLSVAQHRAGYLKAFLETKDDNNYIAAGWSGMAKTFRVKHVKPIVNLPSNNSQYGELVRSCLIAPPGKVFVNADMSSLEDKTKQCCIYPYDPSYVESLNKPGYDAHLNIALLGGFMDEDDIFFYKNFGTDVEMPGKYKDLSEEDKKIEHKKLSKIRKNSKVVNYSCLPTDNTEVLTERGWKFFKDISLDDKVISYSVDKGELEYCNIKNKFFYEDAQVVSLKNSWWNIESTENHRWFGKRRFESGGKKVYEDLFFTTNDITSEHSILNSSRMNNKGIIEVTTNEAELLGWVLSDGYFKWSKFSTGPSTAKGKKRHVRMSLSQSKKKFYEDVKALLDEVGAEYSEGVNNSGVNTFNFTSSWSRKFLDKFGVFGVDKCDVLWEDVILKLSTVNVEHFFDAFLKGDGCTKNTRQTKRVFQNDGNIKDAVKLAGFLLGYRVTENGKGKCKTLNFSPQNYTSGQRLTKTYSRNVDVFCLETDNSTFVIRQNGIITITGNCTYGASAKKVAESGDMPLKDAEKLRNAYWDLNWSVRKFAEDLTVKNVQGKDFIWNPYTKLWLLLTSDHIRFSACNQNFGMCVFELFVYFLIEEGIKPIMTIHDELSFYINEGEEEKTKEIIKKCIDKVNDSLKLPIKFESEPEFAKSYGDLH